MTSHIIESDPQVTWIIQAEKKVITYDADSFFYLTGLIIIIMNREDIYNDADRKSMTEGISFTHSNR
jgi:hypothetical protein